MPFFRALCAFDVLLNVAQNVSFLNLFFDMFYFRVPDTSTRRCMMSIVKSQCANSFQKSRICNKRLISIVARSKTDKKSGIMAFIRSHISHHFYEIRENRDNLAEKKFE